MKFLFPRFGVVLSAALLLSCGGESGSPAPPVGKQPSPTPTNTPAPPPNIIFIAVDDLRPDLGAYGHPIVQTPNIDKLSRSGATFDRAFVSVAVCAPSRAAMLSGLRPETTGIYGLKTPVDVGAPDAVTLPDHFKAAGYRVAGYGKIYHHPDDDADGWTEDYTDFYDDVEWRDMRKEAGVGGMVAAKWKDRSTLHDVKNVKAAVSDISAFAKDGAPFLMMIGIRKPHLPFISPESDWARYDPAKIAGPISPSGQVGAYPWSMVNVELWNYGEMRPYEPAVPDDIALRLRWGYLAAISFADSLVGEITDAVEENGLSQNTVIVLWGDHGFKLGDYGYWVKHSNALLDTRIPLIISAPGHTAPNSRVSGIVESVDIYPTLAEIARIPVANYGDGTSFRPLLSDPDRPWKEAAFTAFRRSSGDTGGEGELMGRTVVTKDFRYTAWIRPSGEIAGQELYDLTTDPTETTNVASAGGYAATIERLENLRKGGWKEVAEGLGE